MGRWRIAALTALALLAFAGNSLLCRAALGRGAIDAANFTSIRLLSGAIALWAIARLRADGAPGAGNWPSALALFAYAAGFSFAYLALTAATGALLLFGAVQATMIGHGLARGERMTPRQWLGLCLALGGLLWLLLPGVSAPPLDAALLMLAAGVAWGVYSLRGRRGGDPTGVTAGNFLRAVPIAAVLSALLAAHAHAQPVGVAQAVVSGALTSGVGYAIWYRVLPALKATQAATLQLSVPLIAAMGAVVLLGEAMSVRLWVAAAAILGGIALATLRRRDDAR